jgi:hypothetical protein
MGFFSSLFNSNIKKFSFDCPMCTRTYNVEFDIRQTEGCDFAEGSNFYKEMNNAKCEFCKTEMVVLYAKDGSKVKARDEKWQTVLRKYFDDSGAAQDALDDIDAEIEDEGSTPAREKKKVQLEAKLDKIETAYENKELKYNDRQCNWQEKWQDKLERMEG